jgi:hypothetical protein
MDPYRRNTTDAESGCMFQDLGILICYSTAAIVALTCVDKGRVLELGRTDRKYRQLTAPVLPMFIHACSHSVYCSGKMGPPPTGAVWTLRLPEGTMLHETSGLQFARLNTACEYRETCVSVPAPLRPQCFVMRDRNSPLARMSRDLAAGTETPSWDATSLMCK